MTLKTEVVSGLKWTAGAKFGGQIITWAITIFVMRLLVPEDYGLLAMASVFVAFLLMIAEIGLGPALVQAPEVDEYKLRQALGIVWAVNIILLVLLNILAPSISSFFDDSRLELILRVMSLQFPLIAISVIPDVHLQRQLDFKRRSLIDLGGAVAASLMTLGLAIAGFGVWALVLGNMLGAIVKAVAVNLIAPFFKLPSLSWHGTRRLLSFGGNVSVGRLLWFFFNQSDVMIIGKLLGKEALGIYSVAMHLASMPVQRVSSILGQVAFPVFARFQRDAETMRNTTIKAIKTLCFFGFPILWGISSVGNELILTLLGENWYESILPLQLIALMMPLRVVANFLPTATDAIGRPDLNTRNIIVASIVMPIAFIVGSRWGIVGIAVAWATVYPIVLLINSIRIVKAVGVGAKEFIAAILPSMFAALGMYASVWAARNFLSGDLAQPIRLAILVGTGGFVYIALTLLVNRNAYAEIRQMLHHEKQ